MKYKLLVYVICYVIWFAVIAAGLGDILFNAGVRDLGSIILISFGIPPIAAFVLVNMGLANLWENRVQENTPKLELCPSCNHSISNHAKSCPNCKMPNPFGRHRMYACQTCGNQELESKAYLWVSRIEDGTSKGRRSELPCKSCGEPDPRWKKV